MHNTRRDSVRTFGGFTEGNLALDDQAMQYDAPQLTLIEGGRSVRHHHDDPFANTHREDPSAANGARYGVMFVVALAFVLIALAGGAVASDILLRVESNPATQVVSTSQVIVNEGDSLWAIAEQHPLEGLSTRDVVKWIEEENSLDSALITVGQRLVVPSGAQI